MHFRILLVLVLTHQALSYDPLHFLQKRDAPLVTVNIPLTVNKDKRYVVGVNMSSSPNTQRFNFVLASNTGYNAVAGTNCDDCNNVTTYNPSLSTTQHDFPGSKSLAIGSSSIIGPFIKENCGLHEVNGSSWLYPNQTIIVANSSNLFSDATSGLIGLGTNANGQSGDFYDTIFGGWLTRNPTRNNFTFGMALQAPDFTSNDDTGNGGILHWVVPDPSAYVGDVTWSTASVASGASAATSNSAIGLPESDWTITLDGWSVASGTAAASNQSNLPAIIEPFYPEISFPASDADTYYGAVSGASKLDTLIDGKQLWSVPCNSNLTLALSIAGVPFPVGANRLVQKQSDGSCTGAVSAFDDVTINSFVLGSSFISTQYLIFVIGRPGSGVPNSIGIASRSQAAEKVHTGAVVGGVVGGVVGLLFLLGIAFILGRRYGRRGKQAERPMSEKFRSEGEKDSKYVTQPLMNSPSSQQFSLPTPPSSAYTNASFRPLLPEAHTPQSPAFGSLPATPVSPMNHPSPTHSLSSNEHGGSTVSYNNAALRVNMGSGTASGGYIHNFRSSNIGDPNSISPYILPQQAPMSSSFRAAMTGPREGKSWRSAQEEHLPGPMSLRDIDPLSPSSGAATVEPFVLGPAPPARTSRGDSKNSYSVPTSNMETPAPPYSAFHGAFESRMNSLRSPASATLVEYSPTTDSNRTDGSQQRRS